MMEQMAGHGCRPILVSVGKVQAGILMDIFFYFYRISRVDGDPAFSISSLDLFLEVLTSRESDISESHCKTIVKAPPLPAVDSINIPYITIC